MKASRIIPKATKRPASRPAPPTEIEAFITPKRISIASECALQIGALASALMLAEHRQEEDRDILIAAILPRLYMVSTIAHWSLVDENTTEADLLNDLYGQSVVSALAKLPGTAVDE